MDDIEEIKKRRLEALKQQQSSLQKQAEEQAQLQQQVEQLENIVRQAFDRKALERYGNLKAAHPEKAVQLLIVLGQLIQSGKVESINDEQLKGLLCRLTPQKKEFKIKRV